MKIIQQTATELKIQTRGVFDFWVPSCLLIVFGLKCVAFDYHLVSLSCHRVQATQGNCQLVRSSLLGSKIQEIQLASLQGAKVVRAGYTSKVVLLTDAGYVRFAGNYTHWGDKDAIVLEINSFDKTLDTLTVKQQGLLGTKLIQHSLREIYGVEVARTKDQDNASWYEVRLLACGGSRISLPKTMNRYEQEKIAKAINNYLHEQK